MTGRGFLMALPLACLSAKAAVTHFCVQNYVEQIHQNISAQKITCQSPTKGRIAPDIIRKAFISS
jgi:hypothetical protein